MTSGQPSNTNANPRRLALAAGLGLLVMALLAAFANFVVLEGLVVPGDAAATANNIIESAGLFRAGIATFVVVAMLDIVVAWALYLLLRPGNEELALLVAWLRLAYAAILAYALVNLLDAAQLLNGATSSTLQPDDLNAQAMSSIDSFDNGWQVGLSIFGLHLAGLGLLLFRSTHFPRLLGGLVALAGAGYLVDAFGTILVSDYGLTVSMYTFVGEALLIPWLLWKALKGFSGPSGLVATRGTPTVNATA